jgi:hypothetical protein
MSIFYPFGLPGNAPGPHAPHACILLLYYSPLNFTILIYFGRGAENRTRISRSQSEYTTTVLRPVVGNSHNTLGRSAENRTRVSRTRSVYTTAVLHSAILEDLL